MGFVSHSELMLKSLCGLWKLHTGSITQKKPNDLPNVSVNMNIILWKCGFIIVLPNNLNSVFNFFPLWTCCRFRIILLNS